MSQKRELQRKTGALQRRMRVTKARCCSVAQVRRAPYPFG